MLAMGHLFANHFNIPLVSIGNIGNFTCLPMCSSIDEHGVRNVVTIAYDNQNHYVVIYVHKNTYLLNFCDV